MRYTSHKNSPFGVKVANCRAKREKITTTAGPTHHKILEQFARIAYLRILMNGWHRQLNFETREKSDIIWKNFRKLP